MRTIVDIPDDQLRALDEICARDALSRAEAVRRAIARYIAEQAHGDLDDAFGLWGDRVTDALVYEDELRGPRDADVVTPVRPLRGGKRRGR